MTEREQNRFNLTIVAQLSELKKRIDDCFANISNSSGYMASMYPVGSVYISTLATNPATTFGFGTWTALAPGRVLVGVGTSDAVYAAGASGGESTHSLTAAENGTHTHVQDAHNHTQNAHGHTLSIKLSMYRDGTGSNDSRGLTGASNTSSDVASNQATTATNQNSGSGTAHNNMPPYLVVYMWQRTA